MIPFVDLKSQYESIRDEIEPAVLETLASTQFVLGQRVAAFEDAYQSYTNTSHAIAVNSGTSALHLALLAAGVGKGDEVITVASTFVATTAAIEYTGAHPVFVDVHEDTLLMDPAQIEAKITSATKAILPVHLHGLPADMDPVVEVARAHGLKVIEDAAQAHGAEYKGRRAGSLGDVGCFSFYPGKNLGAYGEGGMVTTNDEGIAERVRMLRDWGQEKKYHHTMKGFNYRMDGIQGAVLGIKMGHIERWTELRRQHAAAYDDQLANTGLALPARVNDRRHVYHVYAVRTDRRDEMQAALNDAGVGTNIHYPIPVHLQKAYAEYGDGVGSLPVTEKAAHELLSIPMFPEMTEEQIAGVTRAIKKFLG